MTLAGLGRLRKVSFCSASLALAAALHPQTTLPQGGGKTDMRGVDSVSAVQAEFSAWLHCRRSGFAFCRFRGMGLRLREFGMQSSKGVRSRSHHRSSGVYMGNNGA